MAYINKEQKKEIADLLKKEFGTNAKKRGFKYSLSIKNYSTICMKISAGTVDFINNKREVTGSSRDHIDIFGCCRTDFDDMFSGEALKIIEKAAKILNKDNFDKSDHMTDYHHVGHYVDIQIGDYDKPYKLETKEA